MAQATSHNLTSAVSKPVRIGDLLLERGLITQDQLNAALTEQKNNGNKQLIGEILLQLGFIAEEALLESLAEAYGIPFTRVSSRVADPVIIETLPREFLEKHCVLPLFKVQGKLTVAVPEPSNVFLVEEIQRLADCPIQLVASTPKDIQGTLENHLPQANVFVIDDIVDDFSDDTMKVVDQVADITDLMDETAAGESPVIKLVNYIIFSAVEEGASDIHMEPGDRSLRVRFRVDGSLYEKFRPPFQMGPALVSRIKIMGGMDISERRVPQDGAITVMIGKRAIDLRVSTIPSKVGEKVCMRVIDTAGASVGLDNLGFSQSMLDRWRSVVNAPNGIVLVTGPTGSGKSTTLYATLRELADETVNVSTVEDPVEYQLDGINQFQTNDKAGFTFASALRSLLRQDPDIIMVGEIRDAETGKIATQAALTGHLVVSTLHTNDAPSALTRLFNIGIEPYLVAASVNGVLAQRLLRRICKNCKEEAELTPALKRSIERLDPGAAPVQTIYRGAGCPKCHGRGFAGRVGIYELFTPDEETLDVVSRGATLQEIKKLAASSGQYTTLAQDGLEKVRAGVTTVEELLRCAAMG